jgi:hypothetical protein
VLDFLGIKFKKVGDGIDFAIFKRLYQGLEEAEAIYGYT